MELLVKTFQNVDIIKIATEINCAIAQGKAQFMESVKKDNSKKVSKNVNTLNYDLKYTIELDRNPNTSNSY